MLTNDHKQSIRFLQKISFLVISCKTVFYFHCLVKDTNRKIRTTFFIEHYMNFGSMIFNGMIFPELKWATYVDSQNQGPCTNHVDNEGRRGVTEMTTIVYKGGGGVKAFSMQTNTFSISLRFNQLLMRQKYPFLLGLYAF